MGWTLAMVRSNERISARVAAVEGMLAYASSRSRWSGRALEIAYRAVAHSRELARGDPIEHTGLLVRSLRTCVRLLLARRRAAESLPLAEEAVALARRLGEGHLVQALACLSDALTAEGRHMEARAALTEADLLA